MMMPRSGERAELLRGERGAAAVENAGVIVVVVAIVMALLLAISPVGQSIAGKICAAVGTTCGAAAPPEQSDEPTEPCVLATDAVNVKYALSIAFVDVGSGVGMQTEEMSDGTYKTTVSTTAQGGASLTAGELVAKLRVGDYGGGLDVSATASAAQRLGGGLEYTFDSADDAADFEEFVTRTFAKDTAKIAAGPALGIPIEIGNWALNKITGYDYQPPAPTGFYVEGGPVISGSAGAQVIVAGASGSGEFSGALGYRQDFESGDQTVYSKVKIDQKAAADLGLKVLAEGGTSTEIVTEMTVDKDGKLTGLAVVGAATADGSYDLSLLTGMPLQDSGGLGLRVRAALDVNDGNRAQLASALGELGVLGGGSTDQVAGALSTLFDIAKTDGEVTAQTMEVSSSNLLTGALGVKAPAVGGVGVGIESGTSSSSSTSAWYLGDHGWNQWEACS
jgi:Flp pilus assembly pilin Flp